MCTNANRPKKVQENSPVLVLLLITIGARCVKGTRSLLTDTQKKSVFNLCNAVCFKR